VEKKGLKVFLNSGCMVCHTGAYLGGSMFERVGVVEPWPNQEDKGRANVTNVAGDQMMFKVPSLRNVARTGPYFHDGSAETLDDAVKAMGRFQLGLDFSDEEAQSIVSWLHSLTGELPRAYIQKPALPGGK
jgi:cytochrome c peroxidase